MQICKIWVRCWYPRQSLITITIKIDFYTINLIFIDSTPLIFHLQDDAAHSIYIQLNLIYAWWKVISYFFFIILPLNCCFFFFFYYFQRCFLKDLFILSIKCISVKIFVFHLFCDLIIHRHNNETIYPRYRSNWW